MTDVYKLVLRKKEVTYNVDPTPVVGTDAALTRNFQAKPLEMDTLDRNLDLPTRGRSKSANTNARSPFSYELELAGSGTAGTAPPWMIDLQGCGMDAPVISAGISATQKFTGIGSALSSLYYYHWSGNQQRKTGGARGTLSIDFTANAYPFVGLSMTGLVPAAFIADVVQGTPTLTAWKDPVEVNTANTSFTLDGYAATLKSLKLAANAKVAVRNLVGANYVQRGNHAVTGTIVIETPQIASKNYFATLRSGAEVVLQLIHGVVAGNIVQLDASYVQILDIDLSEEDDIQMATIQVGLNIRSGQDDLLLTAK